RHGLLRLAHPHSKSIAERALELDGLSVQAINPALLRHLQLEAPVGPSDPRHEPASVRTALLDRDVDRRAVDRAYESFFSRRVLPPGAPRDLREDKRATIATDG